MESVYQKRKHRHGDATCFEVKTGVARYRAYLHDGTCKNIAIKCKADLVQLCLCTSAVCNLITPCAFNMNNCS